MCFIDNEIYIVFFFFKTSFFNCMAVKMRFCVRPISTVFSESRVVCIIVCVNFR